MRTMYGAMALLGAAGAAHAGGPLATIQDVTVGSSSSPRALQGLAWADVAGIGPLFLTSTGSCVPFIGTGNGLARFTDAWSLVGESDYSAEPCHFGDITIGSDGSIYAPASEYDGIGFTSDKPFQINRFRASDLGADGAWNADALFDTYGFNDLSGADYRHGDLYIVDYRDASPDATNIYVFDLATEPPTMIDLVTVSTRLVNGVESYGNRLYLAADVDSVTARLDVYDLDALAAGVNDPIDSYTFDISDGSSQLGQHSEGLTFKFAPAGPELWVSAALGTIARRIALPDAPTRVTWTGAGSVVGEPFSNWRDYSFGWDGQPTGATDALIDFAGDAFVTIDSAGACAALTVLGADSTAQGIRIEGGGALTSADGLISGSAAHLAGGVWTSPGPIVIDAAGALRGFGEVVGPVQCAGELEADAGATLTIDSLTLEPTATMRADVGDGSAPALLAATVGATLNGAVEVVATIPPEACARVQIVQGGAVAGAFASETLPAPAPGMRTAIVQSASGVDYVQTRGADLDADLTVDGADLGALLGAWGQPGATDLNADGATDGADLG
ncbi:MAG: hypothetical protein ACF8QF_06480, partial [Phycisphaerales bacterium]